MQTNTQQQDQKLQLLEHKMNEQHAQTTQVLHTIQQDFQQSLHTAMQAQDTKIGSGMVELKNLILQQQKKRSATCTPAEDSDMES